MERRSTSRRRETVSIDAGNVWSNADKLQDKRRDMLKMRMRRIQSSICREMNLSLKRLFVDIHTDMRLMRKRDLP